MRHTCRHIFLIFAMVVGLVATSFFAAGSTEAKDVVLKVANWHLEREEVYADIFAEFSKQNPGIMVEYKPVENSQYYNVLTTGIQAGDAPDLFATHGNKRQDFASMAREGVMLDLTGKVDVSGIPQKTLDFGIVDGKLYMTPSYFLDTFVIYYNKGLFQEHGLSIPNSLEELEALCDTLLAKGVIPFALSGKSTIPGFWFYNDLTIALDPDWSQAFPTKEANFNSPAILKGFESMLTYAEKGYFGKDYLALDADAARLAFSDGKMAMFSDGSWMSPSFQEMETVEVGAFHFPSHDQGNVSILAPATDLGYSVFSGTKYPEEAIKLVNFLMSKDANQMIANMGNNIPTGFAVEAGIESPVPLLNEIGIADLFVANWLDKTAPIFKEGYSGGDVMQVWQKVLYREITPAEGVAALNEMVDPASGIVE